MGQDAILNAALALFEKHGFSDTTIQMIADDAGVGVATVFRHFRSKAGIVAELMRRDTVKIIERGMRIIDDAGDDPAKTTLVFLREMLTTADVPAARLKGIERLWLPLPFGHEDTDRLVRWAESELRRLIAVLLQRYRDAGVLRAEGRIEDLAFVVYSVFNQHYLGLSTGDDPSPEEAQRELRRQIPLLFEPWLTGARSVPRR